MDRVSGPRPPSSEIEGAHQEQLGLVLAIAVATGVANTSPVWNWLLFVWALNVSYILWQYIEGLRVNLMALLVAMSYSPRDAE